MSQDTRITLEDAPPPPLPPDGPLDPYEIMIHEATGYRDPSDPPPSWKALDLDRATYAQTLKELKPRVRITVEDRLSGKADKSLAVDVTFDKTSNFWIAQLLERVPELKRLVEVMKDLERFKAHLNNQPQLRTRFEALLKEQLGEVGPVKTAKK